MTKLKNDFVTNSSSVSFLLWGVSLYGEEVTENIKLMKSLYDLLKSNEYYQKKYGDLSFEDFSGWNFDKVQNISYHLLDGYNDIVFTWGQNHDDFIIGKSMKNMSDNETFAQFKKDAEEALKSLGIDKTASMIERSWYDG